MKKIFLILEFLFYASVCAAQVNDDFSDGDLTNNPQWTPDFASHWTVDNGRLRSNSSTASSSFFITTPSVKALEARWEILVTLQFNTSSANYVDVYLTSDQSNLLSLTNSGYFVRIGGTPDEISLYKMNSGTTTLLINGTDGITNSSNNTIRIKVIRDATNTWTLERDATGGTNYFLEGSANDNSFTSSNFFGIRIQQSTASFFNKHFFDDIYAGEIIFDDDPPILEQVLVISSNQLSLQFNEPLLPATAQEITNYIASNGLDNPEIAALLSDEKTVQLTFSEAFQNGVMNELSVTGIKDASGNMIIPIAKPFLFFEPKPVVPKDLIITEIFADPLPTVGLPDAEFVELYNRSSHPVDMSGWTLSDASSTAQFPSQLILPGQYWIITANATAQQFTPLGNVLGVPNFPTLNNSEETLLLRTPDKVLIDSIQYNLNWYRDEEKAAGGWSLELIDINNPCGEEDNWTASENDNGGTPGKVNSVNGNKPDVTGPKLLSVLVATPQELLLVFDEKLEKSLSPDWFTIEPAIEIVAASHSSLSLREVRLTLGAPLAARVRYLLTISNLQDCSGNFIQTGFNQMEFALPEQALPGDVLINEVLFNPRPGGVDFVEIFNASDKYLNLKNWVLGNYENELLSNTRILSSSDVLFTPKTYLAITSDGTILKNEYPLAVETNFKIIPIPSMNDDAGSIGVATETGEIIDSFQYDENMHSPLLKESEGVSLERISFSEPTNIRDNWKSASSAAGFATPGYLNSNARGDGQVDENEVSIEPEIFSPNQIGQDFAKINYKFDQAGWVANIKIADAQGREIKEIANNETLSLEGFFRWDGDRQDGSKARRGYYVVWFEAYSLDGTVKTFRKRVVIGQ